ncbi:hypothetical protein [Desulforamulus ruminis]|uniref:hypothetical protein n=1 Tax=Desulforamulus ruminis TaxID=1564 RepID=UPI002352E248|nr:hypothetical protein [Desulforamulus ruminis]
MGVNGLMGTIKEFLEGKYPASDFSFDFPDLLNESGPELEETNPELYNLLNEDLPEICSYFEPDDEARNQRPEYLNETQFKEQVQRVYEKAVKLMQ